MNILITGASGYIGLQLSAFLQKSGHAIFGIDLEPPENSEYFEKFFVGDIGNSKFISKHLRDLFIDTVILCTHHNTENPLHSYNNDITAFSFFLKTTLEHNIKNYIYLSSDEVYGSATTFPIYDHTMCNPITPIGVSKFAAENLLKFLVESHNIKACILRLFTVVGSVLNYNSSKNNILSQAILHEKFETKSADTLDGTPERDFIYISDVLYAISKVIICWNSLENFNILNVSSGTCLSYSDLKTKIETQIGKTINLQRSNYEKIKKSYGDSQFTRMTLDWRLQYPDINSMITAEINHGNIL